MSKVIRLREDTLKRLRRNFSTGRNDTPDNLVRRLLGLPDRDHRKEMVATRRERQDGKWDVRPRKPRK
jgi:hypothetical protein